MKSSIACFVVGMFARSRLSPTVSIVTESFLKPTASRPVSSPLVGGRRSWPVAATATTRMAAQQEREHAIILMVYLLTSTNYEFAAHSNSCEHRAQTAISVDVRS